MTALDRTKTQEEGCPLQGDALVTMLANRERVCKVKPEPFSYDLPPRAIRVYGASSLADMVILAEHGIEPTPGNLIVPGSAHVSPLAEPTGDATLDWIEGVGLFHTPRVTWTEIRPDGTRVLCANRID